MVERMHINSPYLITLLPHRISLNTLTAVFTLNKVIYVKKIFHENSLNIALREYVKLLNICSTYRGQLEQM